MSIPLSSTNEAFIVDAIARGTYRTRDEAIEAGVDLLRRRDQLLARIDEGRRQLDQGDFVEYDEVGLRELGERLKDIARRSAQESKPA
jgi:Arc/MetJ-type ribon-helix-helix transcriptional regulator